MQASRSRAVSRGCERSASTLRARFAVALRSADAESPKLRSEPAAALTTSRCGAILDLGVVYIYSSFLLLQLLRC